MTNSTGWYRQSRFYRRWHLPPVGAAALALVALLLLVIVLCEIAGWPFLRGPIERQATQSLQRQVSLGEGFRIRFIGSLRVRADSLAIGPAAWDDKITEPSPFVNAKTVSLKVPYGTLWDLYRKTGAPAHIDVLEVGDLQARLLREASGRANWDLLPESSGPKTATPVPTFDRLVLQSGHIVLDDAISVLQLDARVSTNEGQAQAVASSASQASVPDPAASAAGTDSKAAGLLVQGNGSYQKNPFNFHIESDGVLPLLASDTSKTSVRLAFDARAGRSKVTFNGKAVDVMRLTGVDGTYDVSGPSLSAIGDAVGVTLPTTADFRIAGQLKKDGKVFSTNVRELTVGTSRLNGEFRYDTEPATPVLTGQLNGKRLALADLGPAIGAGSSKGAPNPPPPAGKVLPQRDFDIPSLKAMNADVRVRLEQADLGTSALQPFAPLDVNVSLHDGLLLLDQLNARTSGGEVHGSLQLDSRPAQPRFKTDLRWSGVKLEQWLKVSNPRDAKVREGAKPPPYITGDVIGSAKLTGEGKSTAAIVGSLDGNISMVVSKGTISHLIVEAAGLDVAQGLGMLVKGDDPLPMSCALVHLSAKDGLVHTDAGIIDTSDSLLVITGNLSLAKETLDLKMTDKPKDFSPLALRAPLNISGTFAKPSVLPEVKTLSLKVIGAAVLAAITPVAAIIPFIDVGDKEATAGCASLVAKARGD